MRRVTQLSSTPEVRVAQLAPSPVGSSLGHCARSWVLYKHIDKYQKGEGKGGGGDVRKFRHGGKGKECGDEACVT